ncbi:Protein kinase domain-containing protein [Balamuthia mandrillaris]
MSARDSRRKSAGIVSPSLLLKQQSQLKGAGSSNESSPTSSPSSSGTFTRFGGGKPAGGSPPASVRLNRPQPPAPPSPVGSHTAGAGAAGGGGGYGRARPVSYHPAMAGPLGGIGGAGGHGPASNNTSSTSSSGDLIGFTRAATRPIERPMEGSSGGGGIGSSRGPSASSFVRPTPSPPASLSSSPSYRSPAPMIPASSSPTSSTSSFASSSPPRGGSPLAETNSNNTSGTSFRRPLPVPAPSNNRGGYQVTPRPGTPAVAPSSAPSAAPPALPSTPSPGFSSSPSQNRANVQFTATPSLAVNSPVSAFSASSPSLPSTFSASAPSLPPSAVSSSPVIQAIATADNRKGSAPARLLPLSPRAASFDQPSRSNTVGAVADPLDSADSIITTPPVPTFTTTRTTFQRLNAPAPPSAPASLSIPVAPPSAAAMAGPSLPSPTSFSSVHASSPSYSSPSGSPSSSFSNLPLGSSPTGSKKKGSNVGGTSSPPLAGAQLCLPVMPTNQQLKEIEKARKKMEKKSEKEKEKESKKERRLSVKRALSSKPKPGKNEALLAQASAQFALTNSGPISIDPSAHSSSSKEKKTKEKEEERTFSSLATALREATLSELKKFVKSNDVKLSELIPGNEQEQLYPIHVVSSRDKATATPDTPDIVKWMLKQKGVNANTADARGWTALHHCCYSSADPAVIRLLLHAGAKSAASTVDGTRPIDYFVRNDPGGEDMTAYAEALDSLLVDTSINLKNLHHGETLLHSAARSTKNTRVEQVVSLLLSKGADPTLSNDAGETPLHYAVVAGNEPLVRVLLAEPGTDPRKGGTTGSVLERAESIRDPNLKQRIKAMLEEKVKQLESSDTESPKDVLLRELSEARNARKEAEDRVVSLQKEEIPALEKQLAEEKEREKALRAELEKYKLLCQQKKTL